jgi:hypothetical protein
MKLSIVEKVEKITYPTALAVQLFGVALRGPETYHHVNVLSSILAVQDLGFKLLVKSDSAGLGSRAWLYIAKKFDGARQNVSVWQAYLAALVNVAPPSFKPFHRSAVCLA